MNRHPQVISNDVGTLAEDAPALLAAPTDKIIEGIAFDGRKKVLVRSRGNTGEGVSVAGQTVRQHPWQMAGITFGVSALFTCLLARRNGR